MDALSVNTGSIKIPHLLEIVSGKLGTLCELGLFNLCQNKPLDNSAACPVASQYKHLGFNKMQMAQLAIALPCLLG